MYLSHFHFHSALVVEKMQMRNKLIESTGKEAPRVVVIVVIVVTSKGVVVG